MQTPVAPPGPDESRGPELLAVAWTLYFFVIVVFAMRIYTRPRPVRYFRWDDATMTVAFLSLSIQMGILIGRVKNGFGRHNYYVPSANIKEAMRLLIITQLLWVLGIGMCKISVAIMFLRIKQERAWKIFLYSLVLLILITIITTYLAKFVECRPLAALWDPKIPGAKCWKPQHKQIHVYINSAIIIVTDVMFSCLPVTFIRQLNRPLREKIVLCVLMSLGFVASAASIAKIAQASNFGRKNDSLWVTVDLAILSFVEQQLGIIAASLPCLKSTFERALNRFGLLSPLNGRTPQRGIGYIDHSHECFEIETQSRMSQSHTRQ